ARPALVDDLDRERRALATRAGVGFGDRAQLGPRLDREELDLEPIRHPALVRPHRGDLGDLVARDHSLRPSARSSLNFHRRACISSSWTPRISTARIAALTAASTPTVAIGTPVRIRAVIASA